MAELSIGFDSLKRALFALFLVSVLVPAAVADDWTELRGPNRDGISMESSLPESWFPDGENLIWCAP